ncbi:MAG: hypothetical protein H6719_27410 [Sandaracinaceae bacterium]|nr:hypothetical protein [Sandaracinaceae bacterium]
MKRHLLFAALALALVGCSRELPTTFPSGSAASLDEPEAPVASVGVALEQEPPLPGEPSSGWEGLQRDAGAASHGGHDHAH